MEKLAKQYRIDGIPERQVDCPLLAALRAALRRLPGFEQWPLRSSYLRFESLARTAGTCPNRAFGKKRMLSAKVKQAAAPGLGLLPAIKEAADASRVMTSAFWTGHARIGLG
jgi:hypothetical protein